MKLLPWYVLGVLIAGTVPLLDKWLDKQQRQDLLQYRRWAE